MFRSIRPLLAALALLPSLWAGQVALAADEASLVDASQTDAGVVVAAIPAPQPVLEVLSPKATVANRRLAKAVKQATVARTSVVFNSRTERRQAALLLTDSKSGNLTARNYQSNDDGFGDFDDLVMHRSFSRPRLADAPDDDEADLPGVSPEIRLRLLMARLKAVEALALNQVEDDGAPLPERVSQRLAAAREKALARHREKFAS